MNTIPQGYKKTKVGVIPDEWDVVRIDSILKRVRQKVEVNQDQKYQQIGIRSHSKGIFYKELVTGKELGNKSVFWIEEDAFIVNIVFAWEQAIAKTTKNEVGMIASHRFPMYKPKNKKVNLDYLLYFFKSKRGKHLLGLASPGGAGRNKTLGQNEFNELKIPLPSIKEQEQIAEILTTWDSVIEKQKSLIQEKEQLKKGLMQKLFSGEKRLGGFTDKWCLTKLDDIGNFYLGLTYTPKYVEEGIPFLSVKDIRENSISFENTKFISKEEYLNSTNNAKPKKGDILFGRVGTLGNPIVVDTDKEFCIFVSLGYIRVNKSVFNKFLMHWMNSSYFKQQVETQVAGSSQKNLNVGWLKKFNIALPNIEEQEEISLFLDTIELELFLLKQELAEFKQQKNALMQNLLTGKVRVKV